MFKCCRIPLLVISLFLFCFINSSFGQLPNWQIGGYAKDLLTYSDGTIAELPFQTGQWQNAAQVRLNLYWYPLQSITFAVQARNVLIYQKNIRLFQQFQNEWYPDTYFFNMKSVWDDENDYFASVEIDRLNFKWMQDNLEVNTGRQRIAWGTCLVWNPTDLFNPFDILDFDYEERPGTDAVHLQYYTGPLSQINLAISPGRTDYEVVYAARYLTNNWNYDINFIAGWQRNSLRLAASWAGELYEGGFRGEILYTNPDMAYTSLNLGAISVFDIFTDRIIKDPYWTIALSYDYTFENSFYIHTEYLYNGLGTTDNAGSRRFDIVFTGELTPARHSLFQEFAYQVTPLCRADFFVIFNPNDQSWIAAPSIQYSLATNWEIYLLAFPSDGKQGSEFGGYPAQYYTRLKFSF
jgi:hypothetical protein